MGRAPCYDNSGLKKGPWTPEEDEKLTEYIKKHGYGNWRMLPKNAGLQRCGKSCRLRWTNYLRPDIKRGQFSFEEEEAIIQLHSILGNKWSVIASRLPGRTDNEIKNYWNTHIRRRLLGMGIDPVTHSPRLDLLDLSALLNYHPQLDMCKLLLGAQPSINQELLRLANSFATSQLIQHQNQNPLPQNVQSHELLDGHQLQSHTAGVFEMHAPEVPFPSDEALLTNAGVADVGQWQNSENNNMASSTLSEDHVLYMPQSYYEKSYGSHPSNNFSYGNASVLSTPSSSSAYINSCSTEDERESYCSNIVFNFELPNLLGASDSELM